MARCGAILFGSYRKDQFADPEIAATQIMMVFERYELVVVEHLTDVRNSDAIQNRYPSFPPNVGEIRAACEDRAATVERLREAASAPKMIAREYVPPPKYPGCWANLLVRREAPQYEMVDALVSSGTLDDREWARAPEGIRISYNTFISMGAGRLPRTWKRPDLAGQYAAVGRAEAEADKASRTKQPQEIAT